MGYRVVVVVFGSSGVGQILGRSTIAAIRRADHPWSMRSADPTTEVNFHNKGMC